MNKKQKFTNSITTDDIQKCEAKTLANPFWRSQEAIYKEFDRLPPDKQYEMLKTLAEKIGLHLP